MLDFEIHYDAVDGQEIHPHNMFKPVPSVNELPDWFKRLNAVEYDDNNRKMVTGKSCRGIWDILSSGYMLLWPFDVEIIKNENGKMDIYKSRTGENHQDFHPHPHLQLEGYPDFTLQAQQDGVQKVSLPYKIKTPKGTSILMMQPQYRPDLKVEVMTGIIDTDNYYGQLNVLFTIKETNSKRPIKIKSGTPIAQIIPFVRGEWQIKYDNVDNVANEANEALANNVDEFYKRFLWEKKVFKDARN